VPRAYLLTLVFVSLLAIPSSGRASACFSDISAELAGVDASAVSWADYDNDGDLDILITGLTGGPEGGYITRLYRNNGGANPTFTDLGVGIHGTVDGALDWGDYDNDGDLDVLISGVACNTPITRIYRNSGGTHPHFNPVLAGLPGLPRGAVAWGDYDNDGDLDILMSGEYGFQTRVTEIFRSSGGANPTFTGIGAGLTGLTRGTVAWADYDKDGDLDLLATGNDNSANNQAVYYRNNGGANPTFTLGNSLSSFPDDSAADWGDYDNDGDLDILMTGSAEADIHEQISSGLFSNIFAPLVGVAGGSAAWGDFNNDGDLDALLVGLDTNGNPRSSIHQAPTFTDSGANLLGVGGINGSVSGAGAAWGDYDNDGDLDLVLAGLSDPLNEVTRVYRNDCGTTNTPPQTPTNLSASVNGNEITFSWAASTDAQTPSAGLTYNLRVGTVPGGSDVVSPAANPSTGYRRIPAMGNTNLRTSWTIRVPGAGAFYWSVQAIDGSYAGSPFATEQGIGTTAIEEPVASVSPMLGIQGPNPLSNAVTIALNPPERGKVWVGIYDVAGRLVRTLTNEEMPAGLMTRIWDSKDDLGQEVPSGLYLIRMETANLEVSRKVALVR